MAIVLASGVHVAAAAGPPPGKSASTPETQPIEGSEPSAELLEFVGCVDSAPPDVIALPDGPAANPKKDKPQNEKAGVTP
jgi:hypothetical protein